MHTIYMHSVNPVGRPPVVTKIIVQKIEQALRDGFSIEKTCYLSGISRSTFYDHLHSDPDFSDKIQLAQAWATERAKQVVIKEIGKGNLKAAQWWLERKARQEFSTNPLPVIKEEVENDFVAKYFDGNNERMLDWLGATIKALRQ